MRPVISAKRVEDHEINRKLAAIMLGRMACRLSLVPDGQQALVLLAQQRFDVVLMDVTMPVMGGLTVLAHMRAQKILRVTAQRVTAQRGDPNQDPTQEDWMMAR